MPGFDFIVLDSYPLGNAALPLVRPSSTLTESERCRQWMADCEAAGSVLLVPAIAYYEEVRDLYQRQAFAKVPRFQQFCFDPARYIPLTRDHLTNAAQLWGQMRRTGQTTADKHALDGDAILAAQVLSLNLQPGAFTVVTRYAAHITRFGLPAESWENITP